MIDNPRKAAPVLALYLPLFGLAVLAALALTGCSLGFTQLRPGENSALYNHMFDDVITRYDEPHWLWIRGTITGDLDGNGLADQEVVVATIQKGTRRRPGPVEVAFLLVCQVQPDGERQALARTLLFDRDPRPGAPRPVNDLDQSLDLPFTRVRAQMVQDKVSLRETVVVYFYGETTPSSVWYAGYGLDDGRLVKNLETVMYQTTPGFLAANLDRSLEARPYGYQLVFGVAAIPDEIFQKLGGHHDAPLWGHVFARDDEGLYSQADERFGSHYETVEAGWNGWYLRALLEELPAEELAWFEYHLALLNRYLGNPDLAQRFLAKAAANARDDTLRRAIEAAQSPPAPDAPAPDAPAPDAMADEPAGTDDRPQAAGQ